MTDTLAIPLALIAELQKLYSKAEPQKVEQDILGYLQLLHDQRALDFEP